MYQRNVLANRANWHGRWRRLYTTLSAGLGQSCQRKCMILSLKFDLGYTVQVHYSILDNGLWLYVVVRDKRENRSERSNRGDAERDDGRDNESDDVGDNVGDSRYNGWVANYCVENKNKIRQDTKDKEAICASRGLGPISCAQPSDRALL